MVRKLKEMASAEDTTLVDAVCKSAHQIWQAGLGAFSAAQGQGEALFSKLVAEGASLQQQLEHAAGDKLAGPAGIVGKQAAGSWEKLEKVFEDRVGRALHGLGVPTQDDFRTLGRQIEELNRTISQLTASTGQAPVRARKAAPKPTAAAARAEAGPKQPPAAAARRPSRKKAGAAAADQA
jgi:poly(hydroxyalkanoate) granule-associated protein